MSVETFLALAEQGGFLDAKTAAKLRAKVAEQGQAVSTKELATLLVKKGLLTTFQADKLVAATQAAGSKELGLASDSSADSDSTFRLGPGKKSDTKKSLELLDDVEADRMTLLEAKSDVPKLAGGPDNFARMADAPPGLRGLDDLGVDDFDIPVTHADRNIWQMLKRMILQRRPKRGQRWDSSLMLGGGGLLLLLVLVGLFLYFVLATGSGDEMFQMGEEDYKAQLYAQAIQKYDRFVQRYPKHDKVSLARTRIGLARIRSDVATQDWAKAKDTVERELSPLRSEATFDVARSELAGILPDVYEGFVARAHDIQDTDAKERFLDQGDEILKLIENPDNLPSSLRRQIQAHVASIGDQSQQIRREIARRRDILASLKAIQEAIAGGDSTAAYSLRDQLLERHPGANKDVDLQAAVAAISRVERQSIRVINQPVKATTSPRPTAGFRAIPLFLRRGGEADRLTGRILAINARGAIYGIDGSTGNVLWRRWVGFESALPPVPTKAGNDADWLVVDQRHGDLMRLDSATGDLVWRMEVGSPAGVPVVSGSYALQANSAGSLMSINVDNGSIERKVTFPQALSSPPAIDQERGTIYQAAHHSTLYVLDADSLECTRTLHTGHLAGMVTVAPVSTRDFVMFVENSATDFCLLHVLSRDSKGDLTTAGEPLRLKGIVAESPVTYGRNVIVTTDRGAVYVMEAAANNLSEPVRIFAQVHPRTDRTASHFGLLADNRIFIAGWGLAEFEILAARGSLERRWAEQVDDSHFVAPAIFGDTLVTARWAPLSRDVIVEATRMPSAGQRMPESIWQSHIATIPASPPLTTPDLAVLLTGRNGAVWKINGDNVHDQVVQSIENDLPPLGGLLTTNQGGRIFPSGDERPLWMIQDNANARMRLVTLNETARRRVEALPALFEEGMLVCTAKGPIYFVDPTNGKQLAAPFAWPANFDGNADWRTPAVANADFAVVSNSHGIVHRLTLTNGEKRLVSTHSKDLKLRTLGAPAVVGDHAYVLLRGRSNDSLVILSAATLDNKTTVRFQQRVIDPMFVTQDSIVIQTEDSWQSYQGTERRWDVKLPHGPLAGAPLPSEEGWLCTARDGHLFWVDPVTGNLQTGLSHSADIDIGQALGTRAIQWRQTILASGHDSTLHVVPLVSEGSAP